LKNISVIGSGFSGLAAAATLAAEGNKVTVFEKNDSLGGRARQFEVDGFTFDMGPSWYWMPEVFEQFYKRFGHTTKDFYNLIRLDPSYRVCFSESNYVDVPASLDELYKLFERIEKGSAVKLKKFLAEAQYKYQVGMDEFVWKPSHSIREFVDFRIAKSALKLQMFSSISSQIRKDFKHPYLRNILEFPVLFLGAKPQKTPALYSLMNYADLALGTWYPMGGMHEIVKAMVQICKEQGVIFKTSTPVTKIIKDTKGMTLEHSNEEEHFDFCVASADYHHVETVLLDSNTRNYKPDYWDKKTFATSSLLYYIGVDKKIPNLKHHNLFFDKDFDQHADEIYNTKTWPLDPLFYACCPSKTDLHTAPAGKENLFILIPIATGMENSPEEKNRLYANVMDRLEKMSGTTIRDSIVYKREYSVEHFIEDYNSYGGNAYGLANTLMQTAFLKPKIRNKKIDGLFYTGQLTTPGPGVPPSIISGQVVAAEILKKI